MKSPHRLPGNSEPQGFNRNWRSLGRGSKIRDNTRWGLTSNVIIIIILCPEAYLADSLFLVGWGEQATSEKSVWLGDLA